MQTNQIKEPGQQSALQADQSSKETANIESMNESTDKYVRLAGPATIGYDAEGRLTIKCLDKALNPNELTLSFSDQQIMLEDVKLIIEFSEAQFNIQQQNGFNFSRDWLVEITPEAKALMNPSHP